MRNYQEEFEKRVAYIRKLLADSHTDGIVFGNSGGKDCALVGILCKAACFPLDYVSMAHGRKRYFFWMEGVWCNVKTFAVMAGCYCLWGLQGLGWGALASGLIDVVVTTVMTRWFFGISTIRLQARHFLPLLAVLGACAACSLWEDERMAYGGMAVFTVVVSVFCLRLLARRADLGEWLRGKWHREK